jgi:hypothetical protein
MMSTAKTKKPAVKKATAGVTKKRAPASKDVHPVRDMAALCDGVLSGMKNGMSTTKSCEAAGLPFSTFLDQVDKSSELAERYTHARAVLLERMADEIVHISDTPVMGTKSVSKATGLEITEGDMTDHRRLQVESRKWLLARLMPKKYGEKQQVEHSGSVDIAAGILEARKRAAGG